MGTATIADRRTNGQNRLQGGADPSWLGPNRKTAPPAPPEPLVGFYCIWCYYSLLGARSHVLIISRGGAGPVRTSTEDY